MWLEPCPSAILSAPWVSFRWNGIQTGTWRIRRRKSYVTYVHLTLDVRTTSEMECNGHQPEKNRKLLASLPLVTSDAQTRMLETISNAIRKRQSALQNIWASMPKHKVESITDFVTISSGCHLPTIFVTCTKTANRQQEWETDALCLPRLKAKSQSGKAVGSQAD
jgi:hypothetical protein